MQIAIHLGAPFTDDDQILWSLRQDRHALADAGVLVPRPRFYRSRLSQLTTSLRGERMTPEEQAELLAELGADDSSLRCVLSDPRFICATARIWHDQKFYGKAGFKSAWLREVFAGHQVEFFLCLRNPVSFLSALLKAHAPMTLLDHLQGADPGEMFWSEVVAAIRDGNPGCPLTVWCHDDTPLIWPLVLAAVAGVEADTPLAGADVATRPLLTPEGQDSLTAALGDPITATMPQALSALDAHMRLYADPEALSEIVDIPGWNNQHIEAMSEAYEADMERIGTMPGVTLIRP